MEVRGINQGVKVDIERVNIDKPKIEAENNIVPNSSQSEFQANGQDKQYNNEKDIKKAVDKLNKFLEDNKTHAEYEMHDKFNDTLIKIIDDTTGKVIQELPPKKILDMVAKMCEMVGVIFDKKA